MEGWSGKSALGPAARNRVRRAVIAKKMRDTLAVIGALEASGISFVVLKGITIARFDPERDFDDLDILIDRKDVRMAGELLRERFGYSYERPAELSAMDDLSRSNAHDVSLKCRDRIPVELHFRLFNYVDAPPVRADGWLEVDGVRIPSLGAEMQLYSVLMHPVYNHLFLCDHGRWARDISTVVGNNEIDWEGFVGMLREARQSEVAYLALMMIHATERAGFPDHVLSRLRPRSMTAYLRRDVYWWALRFMRDRIFPPRDILSRRYNVSERSIFIPVLYPVDWLRLGLALAAMPLRRPRAGSS